MTAMAAAIAARPAPTLVAAPPVLVPARRAPALPAIGMLRQHHLALIDRRYRALWQHAARVTPGRPSRHVGGSVA